MRSLRLGELAFKPATTDAGQVVAERFALSFRFEKGAERESERAYFRLPDTLQVTEDVA